MKETGISTIYIAKYFKLKNSSVVSLVDKYIETFNMINDGLIKESVNNGGRPTPFFSITYLQFVFLVGLMKNSDTVVNAKLNIIIDIKDIFMEILLEELMEDFKKTFGTDKGKNWNEVFSNMPDEFNKIFLMHYWDKLYLFLKQYSYSMDYIKDYTQNTEIKYKQGEAVGVVYVIKKHGATKIGRSKNHTARIKALQDANGIKFDDIYVSNPTIHYSKIERMIHDKFKDKRLYGEWFDVDYVVAKDEVNKLVDSLCYKQLN
jgi:hypothetical protein